MSPHIAWLDQFFATYYRLHPVDATFIGVHAHDDQLPDLSEHGLADQITAMETLLATCPSDLPADPTLALDCQLARDFLTIQLAECRGTHFWRTNPSLHVGEAIFGVLALFLRDHAPLPDRTRAAIARLRAIPTFLARAQTTITSAPLAWIERAARECDGALAFLTGGLDLLIAENAITTPGLRDAARDAATAFATFRDWLLRDLSPRATANYAAGSDFFDLLMSRGHHFDRDSAAMLTYAQSVLAETEAELARRAETFGVAPGNWRAALAQLADHHPTTADYLDRYRTTWAAMHRTATDHDLLTWPDFPIRYQPIPAWAQSCAPYLYFLHYRAPAPFDLPRLPVHPYLVTPIDTTYPREEQQSRLRATNDAVIKTNHVIHHGGIGHHVQNWHAARAASRIGQIAAVDCASRIAFFSGGTMAEGWSSYTTGLLAEVGFLTPLEQFAELHARLRQAARSIADIGLHRHDISLQDATALYERIGMTPAAAHVEAVKNSTFPGAAVIYLFGTDAIRTLRTTLAAQHGPTFTLRTFHDQLLAHGSIPIPLIAKKMLNETHINM
ncbi:MAG: DUF885 family protein [Thermomicrobiales bacterium]